MTVFSTIDLNSGYYQMRMAEDSKKYTSFQTPFGQFKFNRVPFGLANAPHEFMRTIENLFRDCNFVQDFCWWYTDCKQKWKRTL